MPPKESGKPKPRIHKKWMIVNLEKDGAESIEVLCPKKIKQNLFDVVFSTAYMLPPYSFPPHCVTPSDKKTLKIFFGACILGVILCIPPLTILGGIILAGVCISEMWMVMRYLWWYLRKKLSEGYQIRDPEQHAACEAAGLFK